MAAVEDLLVPGSTELPDCKCGAELRLYSIKPSGDTEVRVFRCDTCQHEFQLMVWRSTETVGQPTV